MTLRHISNRPPLEALLRLEACEERTVPARFDGAAALHLHDHLVKLDALTEAQRHDDHDQTHHGNSGSLLKQWLSDGTSFDGDGSGHSSDKGAHDRAEWSDLKQQLHDLIHALRDRHDHGKKGGSADDQDQGSEAPSAPPPAPVPTPSVPTPVVSRPVVNVPESNDDEQPPVSVPPPVGSGPVKSSPGKSHAGGGKTDSGNGKPDSGGKSGDDPIVVGVDPIDVQPGTQQPPPVSGGGNGAVIIGPVSTEAVAKAVASEGSRPLQAGEVHAAELPPAAKAQPPASQPAVVVADGAEAAPAGDAPAGVEEVPVAPAMLSGAVAAAVPQAANWAPALAPVTELLSRFVPVDPQSMEESIDRFLDRLRDNRKEGTGWLSRRQAGWLGAALIAGLTSGEVARRKRVPQRVTRYLSRSRF